MRASATPQPVSQFAIPPHAPAAVADAKERFDKLALEWAKTKDELRDAEKTGLQAAVAADVRHIADAAAKGKTVADPNKNENEAHALIRSLRAKTKGLEVALDEAGNTLATEIARGREAWLEATLTAEEAAAREYAAAVEHAQAAADDLATVRGAARWLEQFNGGMAVTGRQNQFAGGQLTVRSRTKPVLRGTYAVRDLLDVAAEAAAPPQPRQSRVAAA